MLARPALALTLIPVVLVLAACSSGKEVSFHSGGMTHTFAEGEGAVPRDFPLPLYPGARLTGSVQAHGDGDENNKFLMCSTSDTVQQVSTFYQKALKDQGWTLAAQQTLPTMVNIAATRADSEANVMASGDGKQTSISLSVSKEPKGGKVAPTGQNFTPEKLNPPTD